MNDFLKTLFMLLIVGIFYSITSGFVNNNGLKEGINMNNNPNQIVSLPDFSKYETKHLLDEINHKDLMSEKNEHSVDGQGTILKRNKRGAFGFFNDIKKFFGKECDPNNFQITTEKTNKTEISTYTNVCTGSQKKYERSIINFVEGFENFCNEKWINEIPLDRSNNIENSFNNSAALQTFIFKFNYDKIMKELANKLAIYKEANITVEVFVDLCIKNAECRNFFKDENKDFIEKTFYKFLNLTPSDIIKLYVHDKKNMDENHIYYNILHNKKFLNGVLNNDLLNHCLINNMKYPEFYSELKKKNCKSILNDQNNLFKIFDQPNQIEDHYIIQKVLSRKDLKIEIYGGNEYYNLFNSLEIPSIFAFLKPVKITFDNISVVAIVTELECDDYGCNDFKFTLYNGETLNLPLVIQDISKTPKSQERAENCDNEL